MLIDRIIEIAKYAKVLLFCDMDGVLVEYNVNQKQDIVNNFPNIYFNNRPLTQTIKSLKEIGKIENVELAILSNCYHKEQREDKIRWLKKYADFIPTQNIHIIVYDEENFTKEEKDFVKVNHIKTLVGDRDIVPILLEDNHNIIKATNKVMPNTAYHVSEIIY